MNARTPASADTLTEILSDATRRIEEAQTITQIEAEYVGCLRVLIFAQRHSLIGYHDTEAGISSITNVTEQAKRNMRARIDAARTGVMQVAA